MPQATRLGDMHSGHDACPPTPLSVGSPNVFVNSLPAGRLGDAYAPHGCEDHDTHTPHVGMGSASVFINGIPAGRVGDPTTCGATVAQGSPDVIIGG